LQQTLSVNDIYPQNTKLLFTQPNICLSIVTLLENTEVYKNNIFLIVKRLSLFIIIKNANFITFLYNFSLSIASWLQSEQLYSHISLHTHTHTRARARARAHTYIYIYIYILVFLFTFIAGKT